MFLNAEATSDAKHAETLACSLVLELSIGPERDLVVEFPLHGHRELQFLILFFGSSALLPRFVIRLRQNLSQSGLARRRNLLIPGYDTFSHLGAFLTMWVSATLVHSTGQSTLARQHPNHLELIILRCL